ncbi:hypothetical protein [Burkholderia sp. Leaf177]|uniref:hypothetical protein n=1 Tax=Burkholderia sp. Leaf177 TaxID=1736287 RepID=UPI000AF00681|nr:hypothetical protein [Burkholderia sp. Leaf177]
MKILKARVVRIFCASLIVALFSREAFARNASEEASKSDKRLNLTVKLNIRNYCTPSVFGRSAHTHRYLPRPIIPILPNGGLTFAIFNVPGGWFVDSTGTRTAYRSSRHLQV